jgi:asparagine synthase (glutamine-hydrolysing)
MPGIAGIFAKHTTGTEDRRLERMVALMGHRSFYRSGRYSDKSLGVYAGYMVLADSFADCMPIWNEAGDVVLFLTGECYIDPSVSHDLVTRGHDFPRGNASYLVHLYEEEGESFFGRLNGWHNGLIIDHRIGKSYLFNDRFGMRRIYYRETSEGLFFSSEAKSLLAIFPETRAIDPYGLGEFLNFGSVLSNRTLFHGVQVLPPDSLWIFDGKEIARSSHDNRLRLESQPELPASVYLEKLEETFERILPRYLVGEPKCLALTGGLDTRLIIACADVRPGELPCLTHGGMYKEMLDVSIARDVARTCGQSHRVIPLDRDFLMTFPEVSAETVYLTDGLADVAQSHLLFLNRIVRNTFKIKITGKYGSQVIKHLSAFHRPTGYGSDEDLISPDFRQYSSAAKATFKEHDTGHPLSQMVFKEIPWWWSGISAIEFSQLNVRSPYLDNEFIELLYRSPFESIDPVRFQLGIVKKVRPDLFRIMTNAGYGGSDEPIARSLRRFYYRLIGLIEKAYGRDKLPYSLQHQVAMADKRLLSPLHLNKLFLGKADYRHYRLWTRGELSPYIKSVLLDERTLKRPFWDSHYLAKAVTDHVTGKKNRLNEIIKALSIELAHRTLIERVDSYHR